MAWSINFCAPFLPNDPTINAHRYFQACMLLLYTLIYALLHAYYKFWGPLPLTSEKQAEQQTENKEQLENFSQLQSQDGKEVSIKLEEMPNDSCVQLKKTNNTWEKSAVRHQTAHKIKQNVTIAQIESYCPIVYGHFTIAMGISIMYTPYAQQSIASLFYILFTIPLLFLNSRRHFKSVIAVWIVMVLLILFIVNSALLQVGQSNWDRINLTCFAKEYVTLYN